MRSGRVVLAVAAAAGLLVASSTSASPGTAWFSGNLCAGVPAGSLAVLKISGPCVVVQKGSVRVRSTPLGSLRSVAYSARAGQYGSISDPKAHLSIQAINVQGSAAAVAYLRKGWRAEVLKNGILFSSKPLATESGDTFSCHNPPTGDCTEAEILGLVGQYAVTIGYEAPTELTNPDDPQNPSVDEANDRAQEEAIKGPFVALAKAVMAKL
jgi:hypothetical protein